MSEYPEPVAVEEQQPVMPVTHQRILVIMAVLGVLGSIAGFVFISPAFGSGILIGSILAFVNYYWLKRTVRRTFETVGEGEKPRLSALTYFLRYAVLALTVAVLFVTNAVSIFGLILGMASFGFAVVVEGFISIFIQVFSRKGI